MTKFIPNTPLLKEFFMSLLFSLVIANAAILVDSNEIHSDLHSYISDYCETVYAKCESSLEELDVTFATSTDIAKLNDFGTQAVKSRGSSKQFSEEEMRLIDESALDLFERLRNPDSGVSSLNRLLKWYVFFLFLGCTFFYMMSSLIVDASKNVPTMKEISPKTSVIRALAISTVLAFYIIYL